MLVCMALAPATRRGMISTGLAVALASVVLLTLLGHGRLTDWDEGIYAGISRAMVDHGAHLDARLAPRWNGQLWLEKPPLMLWITAVFFRIFGISEFTARLGSALSGIVLVGLLHGWLMLRRDAMAAWLNTVVLLSTLGFLHVARVGEMDVLLALSCTVALIGLCELQGGNASGWLLFWLGFAVAVMTKGAASVTLPITLVCALAVIPTLRRHWGACALGLLIFLLLTLPWHLYMLHRFGSVFVGQYVGLHVLTRATAQIEGHWTPWYFYLRVLLVSAAPWVLLYPFAVDGAFRRPGLRALRVFALFALVVLTIFTIAQTRLPHYIAPIYPALSVLTAAWLATQITVRLKASANPRALTWQLTAGAVAVYLVAVLLTAAPRRSLHSPRLPNGNTTPDNREQVALLKQVFARPSPQVAAISGPLLTLRTGLYNPIPTTVFYSARNVQQVAFALLPPGAGIDIYANDPLPLGLALPVGQPHLLLADRTLLSQLPGSVVFQPIAVSANLALGSIALR
jgi:4-amino-4-deoxy-L-arabinose transferase-like glycosyltransferase